MKRKLLLAVPLVWGLFEASAGICGIPTYALNGSAVVWDTSQPIRYRVDPGSLGSLPFDEALQLLQLAMDQWEDLTDAQILFEYLGPASADITSANHDSFIDPLFDVNRPEDVEDLLIIFDSDGAILSSYGKDVTVAGGLTQLGAITSRGVTRLYAAQIILNGLTCDGDPDGLDPVVSDTTLGNFVAVVVHELGHSLGLNHTILNQNLFRIDAGFLYLPTMYPLAMGSNQIVISPDERAEILRMYGASLPVISGRVLDASGSPVDDVLVTARNIRSPFCRSYAVLTGWPDETDSGSYSIPVLEPGDYVLEVTQYRSSVPVPGGAEFYNQSDASDENFDQLTVVSVAESVSGLDFRLGVSNPSAPTVLDDEVYFARPDIFNLDGEDELCPEQLDAAILGVIGTEAEESYPLGEADSDTLSPAGDPVETAPFQDTNPDSDLDQDGGPSPDEETVDAGPIGDSDSETDTDEGGVTESGATAGGSCSLAANNPASELQGLALLLFPFGLSLFRRIKL